MKPHIQCKSHYIIFLDFVAQSLSFDRPLLGKIKLGLQPMLQSQ